MATNSEQKPEQLEKFPFFSLSNSNQFGLGLFGSSTEESLPPPPCVEVLFSEASSSVKYTLESVAVDGGLTLLKGRVSTHEVFALSNSDLVPGKYEGGLKLWEGSLDLVKTLHSEILDGQLTLTGKRVLELGCGHGLPGIFAYLKGADVVHFQDFNAEVLQCLTIPNLNANLGKESQHPLATKQAEGKIEAKIRFFAGEWSKIHPLLSHACGEYEKGPDSRSEHDFRVGYDIILMAETVYSISSLQNLYELAKKCLSRPYGIAYVAGKKHYFGVGGGTRQFLAVVEKDGVMEASLIAEVTDGSSNVREVWKFSLK